MYVRPDHLRCHGRIFTYLRHYIQRIIYHYAARSQLGMIIYTHHILGGKGVAREVTLIHTLVFNLGLLAMDGHRGGSVI